MINEIIKKIKFDKNSDRLGPDCPFTHYKLYFKKAMRKICNKKFKYFGENAEFRPGAYAIACSNISIGKRVVIRPLTMIFADPVENGAGVTIEDDVLIGSGVHFYCGNHKFDDPNIPIYYQGHSLAKPITVKRGAWIGANSIILPGVTIHENSVVAAGAIVTHDVEAKVVVGGVPARVIKKIV